MLIDRKFLITQGKFRIVFELIQRMTDFMTIGLR